MRKREKRAKHCERAYMRGAEGRSQNREAGSSCVIADGLRRRGRGAVAKISTFLGRDDDVALIMFAKNMLIHPGKSENKL